MKTIIICSFFIFTAIGNIHSQNSRSLNINNAFNKNDTTSSFSLNKTDVDGAIKIMIKTFGTPETNHPGVIIWKNVPVDGLGNNLTIMLSDGIFSFDSYTFTTFSDQKDKSSKISGLKKSEVRNCSFEILKNDTNIVNNQYEIDLVQKMFDQLLTGLK